MNETLRFARLFLFEPSKAADACARKSAIGVGLRLYALLALAQLASAWFNPLSFLDPTAALAPAHGGAFWFRVALWEPVVFAGSVFVTVLALDWMRSGWLPLRTAVATFWSALPLILTLYYTSPGAPSGPGVKAALAGVLVLWAVPAAALARRIPREKWETITAFLLGLSAIELVSLAAEYATVLPLRSRAGFIALSLASLLWVLACVGVGLRKLTGASTARVVLAFLFALVVTTTLPSLAFLLGLMPLEVMKVVMYV